MSNVVTRRGGLAAHLISVKSHGLRNGSRRGARRTFYAATALLLSVGAPGSLLAQETTTFKYDAKGRLTETKRTGGPSNGVVSTYEYDNADNRKKVSVSGSPNGTGNNGSDGGASAQTTRYIVVPLNGLTLIPVG